MYRPPLMRKPSSIRMLLLFPVPLTMTLWNSSLVKKGAFVVMTRPTVTNAAVRSSLVTLLMSAYVKVDISGMVSAMTSLNQLTLVQATNHRKSAIVFSRAVPGKEASA